MNQCTNLKDGRCSLPLKGAICPRGRPTNTVGYLCYFYPTES